jgi:hypothetical protein
MSTITAVPKEGIDDVTLADIRKFALEAAAAMDAEQRKSPARRINRRSYLLGNWQVITKIRPELRGVTLFREIFLEAGGAS